MRYFFTSDNHFWHKNIKKFCPASRVGETVQEMNALMIRAWQNQVQPEDFVYVHGDVFFCDAEQAITIMEQLPGQKFLVYGNHDKAIRSNAKLRSMFVSVAEWREVMLPVPDPNELGGERKQKVIMHHYPTYEWKDMHKGAFHTYGHIHSRYGEQEHPGIPGRCMDVGIDSRPKGDMTLWSWEEVYKILIARRVRGHHEVEL
jgi:calcineurin-like phosphoesterase family protein